MAYNHTATILLVHILVAVCIGKDITDGSSTNNCTYSLICEKKFQGKNCHEYSNIHIDQDHDCTTDSYPTNPDYQSANPSSQYTANSKCTCNNVLTSSTTTATTTITATTTTIITLSSSAAAAVEPSCPSTTDPVPENTLATAHTVCIPVCILVVLVVFLVLLVAVTITMTTLVVYMCLMMRRAKSGRVPQTTKGTTHTNNMATNEYCELESATSQKAEHLKKSHYGCDQPSTHPPLPQPPTSDNATFEPTSPGSHEYELLDEVRKNIRGKTTGEVHVAVEGVESKKDKKEEAEKQEEEERKKGEEEKEEEESKEEEEEEKEEEEDNGTTQTLN